MQRLKEKQLIDWKNSTKRKPLLVDGARQVGKTYLISHIFAEQHFRKVHLIDLRGDTTSHSIFNEDIRAKRIFENIELYLGEEIRLDQDLIFLDEIGECQRALDALKYVAESEIDCYVCASGSNIGLLDSYPVGKVTTLELYPMSFEEFLMASGDQMLLERFRKMDRSELVHKALWAMLLQYYFTGGMPEAVAAWWAQERGIDERMRRVTQVHKDLLLGYERDFGKYAGKENALHISQVFSSIPLQLSADQDESTARYRFRGVIEKKQRYKELSGPISWLEKTKLVLKNYPISSQPRSPLGSLVKDNIFKLFFFDIGLLGHMLQISYKEHLTESNLYKGYYAENFVQQELRSLGLYPTYSWKEANSEIEFLHKTLEGEIIPVEVKSGKRTQAKSLRAFVERYNPERTLKLTGAPGGTRDAVNLVWPLYYTRHITTL